MTHRNTEAFRCMSQSLEDRSPLLCLKAKERGLG